MLPVPLTAPAGRRIVDFWAPSNPFLILHLIFLLTASLFMVLLNLPPLARRKGVEL